MADNDSGGELIGALLWIFFIVMVVITAVMALMSVGALFGAGTALRNYAAAFSNNVKPERVPS
jgi:hypothetical protein